MFEINALYINFPIYHIYKAVLGKSPEFPVLLPYTLDFIILSSLMWAMGGALICLITAPLAPKIKNSYRKRKEIFIGALALGLIGTLAAILSSKGLGTDSSFVFFLTLIPLFFLEIASRLFPFFRAEGLILTGPVFIFFNGMIWVAIGAFVGYLLHLFKKDYFFHFIVI
ncbi:MAG: hypothetical protein K9J85_10065 [Desulfobacteraceae bacterium]|nr:hypothetical protein [Desulfobacteraceae bacterium]